MPLHAQHEVIGRSAFHRFFHAVLGTPRHQPQSIAHHLRRLMMAGVHRHDQLAAFAAARPPRAESPPASTAGSTCTLMRLGDFAVRLVLHALRQLPDRACPCATRSATAVRSRCRRPACACCRRPAAAVRRCCRETGRRARSRDAAARHTFPDRHRRDCRAAARHRRASPPAQSRHVVAFTSMMTGSPPAAAHARSHTAARHALT